jgi:hypothetical protein
MIRRLLFREGRPPVPVRPVASTASVAEDMPPRPQLRIPDRIVPPVTGGVPFHVYGGGLNAAEDPTGRGPMAGVT